MVRAETVGPGTARPEVEVGARAAVAASFRVVRTLWLAEAIVVGFIWLGLPALLARPEAEGGPAGVFARIFIAVAIADLVLGWWIRNRAKKGGPAPADGASPAIMGASLVAVTLALTPGILAAALYLGFGHVDGHRILSIMSLAGLWVLQPRLDEWTVP
jgi:hypothetical protein